MLSFSEYQKESAKTAVYPNIGSNFIYPALGLAGETGEVMDKISKIIRDDNERLTEERRKQIEKELGDVLWFLAQLCTELGLDLSEVAQKNLDKLFDRKRRGVLHGSGDDR